MSDYDNNNAPAAAAAAATAANNGGEEGGGSDVSSSSVGDIHPLHEITVVSKKQQQRRESGSYMDRKSNYLESINDGSLKEEGLPSCEFRSSIRSSVIQKTKRSSFASTEFEGGIGNNAHNAEASISNIPHKIFTFLTKGGTVFDGFLLAASQEVCRGRFFSAVVGLCVCLIYLCFVSLLPLTLFIYSFNSFNSFIHYSIQFNSIQFNSIRFYSILTLPWVFSLVGMGSGITLQILFATCALYTNYLLVNLHTEFRKRLAANKNDPRSDDPHYIVSYHDIMGGLIGPKSKTFALLVVILALYGLSVVQIISTGSNMYLLYDGLSKRTWSIIAGCPFSLVVFIPNFRHYRLMVILANIATTYTSWFMTINAALIGPIPDVIYDAPRNVEDWFRGMVSLLFCFGGHASNIEVADVMDDHSTYDKSYFYSFLYVFTLTMPNAITAYHTFGNEARLNQNAFGLYEQSPARDFGIVMMTINNLVAYGLFLGPLFHIWENFFHIHHKAFWIRAIARLPLCGSILLIAVAFPFFGPINSVLGAFTTSFATYIIPLVAFNLVFNEPDVVDGMSKPLPKWAPDIHWVRYINWLLALVFLIGGVGIGGWASVTNFIVQIENFDYFADCYMCAETLNP